MAETGQRRETHDARGGALGDDPEFSVARAVVELFGARTCRKLGRFGIQVRLADLMERIDRAIERQVDVVIHDERFQELEARWRGLRLLVDQVADFRRLGSSADDQPRAVADDLFGPDFEEAPSQLASTETRSHLGHVDVQVLDVRFSELRRDLEGHDFDQTDLFRKIYSDAFGTPGGIPFGMLLGVYDVEGTPADVNTLRGIVGVGAAAFCPLLVGAAPSLLGLSDLGDLEHTTDLRRLAEGIPGWSSLRDMEDARFLGVIVPRVLMRTPYRGDVAHSARFHCARGECGRKLRFDSDGGRCPACGQPYDADDHTTVVDESVSFAYRESVGVGDSTAVWGSGVFAFASVAARSFVETGWFSDVVGLDSHPRHGTLIESGGLVTALPIDDFATDSWGVVRKPPVDVVLDDVVERSLASLGFVPISVCRHTEFLAFQRAPSVQKAIGYAEGIATANARLSAMLPSVLCAARFAHYLKVIARDKTGSPITGQQLEDELNRWLHNFVSDTHLAQPEDRARHPLRKAHVAVRTNLSSPGQFDCDIHLVPHGRLEQLEVSLDFRTQMTNSLGA